MNVEQLLPFSYIFSEIPSYTIKKGFKFQATPQAPSLKNMLKEKSSLMISLPTIPTPEKRTKIVRLQSARAVSLPDMLEDRPYSENRRGGEQSQSRLAR